MAISIIDRDIDFYKGEIERAGKALRECRPEKEHLWARRIARAADVFNALKEYKIALERET